MTSRCWHEDAPALTTARGAIIKFLERQDQHASGTEPFAAASRPDTFTYHFGRGRGVRWHDKPRGLLWLCAFDDAHDRGYEHAERLQQSDALYPDIEQHTASPASALLPWGMHADEDAHEWAQAIYGALETWETMIASHMAERNGSIRPRPSRAAAPMKHMMSTSAAKVIAAL